MSKTELGFSTGKGFIKKKLLWSGELEIPKNQYTSITLDEDVTNGVYEIEFAENKAGARLFSQIAKIRINDIGSGSGFAYCDVPLCEYTHGTLGESSSFIVRLVCAMNIPSSATRDNDVKKLYFRCECDSVGYNLSFLIRKIYRLAE